MKVMYRTPVVGLITSDRVLGAQTEFAVGLGRAQTEFAVGHFNDAGRAKVLCG
jgi:hypothetical protein